MNSTYSRKLRSVVGSLCIILISAPLLWRLVNWIHFMAVGPDYSRGMRLLTGVATAVLSLLLLEGVRRLRKASWNELGVKWSSAGITSFVFGFLLWLIPASFGVALCVAMGWAQIELSPFSMTEIMGSLLLLALTVLLIEALPEELIFRGVIYRSLHVFLPQWAVVLVQVLLFSLFAWLVGALYSWEQIQFIPGFALILGYLRAVSGTVWTAVGFHTAMMTFTQLLGPVHGHVEVSGMLTLKFIAFILLPSMLGGMALGFMYPKTDWGSKLM